MVINYKEVNKNTKFDGYYIPNKEILINLAKGKNYYSKFDCKLVMVSNELWIKNAPQIFQRKMDKIFFDYSSFIIIYINDILIYLKMRKIMKNI